jgi:hypothetical protein
MPLMLAAEHGELVAQRDDLDVFGTPGPDSEPCQRREEAIHDAIYTRQDWRVSALVNGHVRVSGTDGRMENRSWPRTSTAPAKTRS